MLKFFLTLQPSLPKTLESNLHLLKLIAKSMGLVEKLSKLNNYIVSLEFGGETV
jgi:hypothetical protein